MDEYALFAEEDECGLFLVGPPQQDTRFTCE